MSQSASREEIVGELRAGRSVTAIARDLHADKGRVRRIRDELGIEPYVPVEQRRTLEEKWEQFTRPLAGGHLEWTGERGKVSGSPVLRYGADSRSHSPAAVAFRIRTGQDPQGQVYAECGMRHCVAPDHVHDAVERAALRAQLRSGAFPEACRYGHASSKHRRIQTDGKSYCALCKRMEKNPALDDRARPVRPQSPEELLAQCTRTTEAGHVEWIGPANRGRPGMVWGKSTLSPARVAFQSHYGRPPQGCVTSVCHVPHCLAGPCLRDRVLRQADKKVDRLYKSIFGTAA